MEILTCAFNAFVNALKIDLLIISRVINNLFLLFRVQLSLTHHN